MASPDSYVLLNSGKPRHVVDAKQARPALHHTDAFHPDFLPAPISKVHSSYRHVKDTPVPVPLPQKTLTTLERSSPASPNGPPYIQISPNKPYLSSKDTVSAVFESGDEGDESDELYIEVEPETASGGSNGITTKRREAFSRRTPVVRSRSYAYGPRPNLSSTTERTANRAKIQLDPPVGHKKNTSRTNSKQGFCHEVGICWVCDEYGFHLDPGKITKSGSLREQSKKSVPNREGNLLRQSDLTAENLRRSNESWQTIDSESRPSKDRSQSNSDKDGSVMNLADANSRSKVTKPVSAVSSRSRSSSGQEAEPRFNFDINCVRLSKRYPVSVNVGGVTITMNHSSEKRAHDSPLDDEDDIVEIVSVKDSMLSKKPLSKMPKSVQASPPVLKLAGFDEDSQYRSDSDRWSRAIKKPRGRTFGYRQRRLSSSASNQFSGSDGLQIAPLASDTKDSHILHREGPRSPDHSNDTTANGIAYESIQSSAANRNNTPIPCSVVSNPIKEVADTVFDLAEHVIPQAIHDSLEYPRKPPQQILRLESQSSQKPKVIPFDEIDGSVRPIEYLHVGWDENLAAIKHDVYPLCDIINERLLQAKRVLILHPKPSILPIALVHAYGRFNDCMPHLLNETTQLLCEQGWSNESLSEVTLDLTLHASGFEQSELTRSEHIIIERLMLDVAERSMDSGSTMQEIHKAQNLSQLKDAHGQQLPVRIYDRELYIGIDIDPATISKFDTIINTSKHLGHPLIGACAYDTCDGNENFAGGQKALSKPDYNELVTLGHTDSGYGSLEVSEDRKSTTPWTSLSRQEDKVQNDVHSTDSRSIYLNEVQRVTRCEEDIQSRIGRSHLPEILQAEDLLITRLCEQEPFINACQLLEFDFKRLGLPDTSLLDDITEMLKYYFTDIQKEATSRLEHASANLVRSHSLRERIASRIIHQIRGDSVEDIELEDESDIRLPIGMSRDDLNNWLANNPAFANSELQHGPQDYPEQLSLAGFKGTISVRDHSYDPPFDHLESQVDENQRNLEFGADFDRRSEVSDMFVGTVDDVISDIVRQKDLVARMEQFLLQSKAFRSLIERVHLQTIRPTHLSLRRILMSLPMSNITFTHYDNAGSMSRCKSYVERNSVCAWNWWPLSSPDGPTNRENMRIKWICHCGRKHHQDVATDDGQRLKRLLANRVSLWREHICLHAAKRRRSLLERLWRLLASRLGQREKPYGEVPLEPYSSTSAPGSSPTDKMAGSGNLSCSVKQSQELSHSGHSNERQSFTSSTANSCDDHHNPKSVKTPLRLVFGTVGRKKLTLAIKQPRLEHCMRNTEAIFQILKAYRRLRGEWRYHFSIFQLETFIFTKFAKHDRKKVYSLRDGYVVPESDPDYEYGHNSTQPPCPERPPVDRSEFVCLIDVCPKYCFFGLTGWHECNEPSIKSDLVSKLPKKKSYWDLEDFEPSTAWGLNCAFEISAFRVLLWHLAMVIVCFGMWSSLQSHCRTVMEHPIILLAFILVAVSAFWASARVLQTSDTDATMYGFGTVQANNSYVHQGDIFATNFSPGISTGASVQSLHVQNV